MCCILKAFVAVEGTCRVYSGKQTASVREQFAVLVRSAFREFVRDEVNARIKSALEGGEKVPAAGLKIADDAEEREAADSGDEIETTPEEIEGFHIVRAILAKHVDPARVIMRDTKSYCGVLLDDNNRKPICRAAQPLAKILRLVRLREERNQGAAWRAYSDL